MTPSASRLIHKTASSSTIVWKMHALSRRNYWMMHLTDRIQSGKAMQEDVDLLYDVASQIKGKCLCALGEFSIEAVLSGIDRFGEDFTAAVKAPEAVAGE
jgi:hypothetical protein